MHYMWIMTDTYSNTTQSSSFLQRITRELKKKKMMMQSELLNQPSWQAFNFPSSALLHHNTNTPYDDQEMDFSGLDDLDFSSSFASPENSSLISSNLFLDEFLDHEINITSAIGELEAMSNDIYELINGDYEEGNSSSPLTMEGDHQWSPSLSLESTQNSTLVLPGDDMEVDDQLSLLHLLRAYGEAMENGEKDLGEVIVKSINDKSGPQGNTMERVAYNLFRSGESQGEYLREESIKNLAPAFMAWYQSLPNGRFAHFTANSAILESMPDDVKTIWIVDFDLGEGIQWPPLIEALSKKSKAMKLTSIKLEDEESTASCWSFEDTKKRLLSHATQFGLKMQIEEQSVNDLGSELMMKRREQTGEWMAFNCMVGLPHMGRRRPRRSVDEFVKLANDSVANGEGILNIGYGEAGESLNTCCGYSSYFGDLLRHYQALFESLEGNFPVYLAEARTAMESLFLAPFMCPVAWWQEWDETRKGDHLRAGSRLEGRKLSRENLAQAKQMVIERENSYTVRIERMRENEMVLQWKEIPLVRVSTWM